MKDQVKSSEIQFEKDEVTLKDVVDYVKDNLVEDRVELFAVNGSVYVIYLLSLSLIYIKTYIFFFSRPGILVLVNDTDWELLNGIDSVVSNNDEIVFISTLHGG